MVDPRPARQAKLINRAKKAGPGMQVRMFRRYKQYQFSISECRVLIFRAIGLSVNEPFLDAGFYKVLGP